MKRHLSSKKKVLNLHIVLTSKTESSLIPIMLKRSLENSMAMSFCMATNLLKVVKSKSKLRVSKYIVVQINFPSLSQKILKLSPTMITISI